MSLMLEKEVAERSVLPREYVLEVTNSMAMNTFVFSEKDLPGYTTKLRGVTKAEAGAPTSPGHRSIVQDRTRLGPHGIEKDRKGQGRRGVPSK